MAGLHAQSRRKGEKRSVDMSLGIEEAEPWSCPPADECEQTRYTLPIDGADPALHQVKVRLVTELVTADLVRFAVVQQTLEHGRWRDVVEVDTCHDCDVHLHQYARRTHARIGELEVLAEVRSVNEVQGGYDVAYGRVFEQWEVNVERWRNG
jgi:hypothetical protein